jgi:hypothetical protein
MLLREGASKLVTREDSRFHCCARIFWSSVLSLARSRRESKDSRRLLAANTSIGAGSVSFTRDEAESTLQKITIIQTCKGTVSCVLAAVIDFYMFPVAAGKEWTQGEVSSHFVD